MRAARLDFDDINAGHGSSSPGHGRAWGLDLRPDLLVKGGDYTADSVPEAALVRALGGDVRILDLVPERSTTRIIERLGASDTR